MSKKWGKRGGGNKSKRAKAATQPETVPIAGGPDETEAETKPHEDELEPEKTGDATAGHAEKENDKLSPLSIAKEGVKRIHNEGMLYSIVLFAIAVSAVILLLQNPNTPNWLSILAVTFLLGFVFLVAYLVGRPFFGKPIGQKMSSSDTLGSFLGQLEHCNEEQLDNLRQKLKLPPFPVDCVTREDKMRYLVELFPTAGFLRKRELVKVMCIGSASLLLFPLWIWYDRLPSAQEVAIHTYYDGINLGISGDEKAWDRMWSVLTDRQKAVRRAEPGGERYPAHFKDTYKAPHTIRSIKFSFNNGERKPVYSVIYETREVVYPNPLNQWLNPSTHRTLKEFYSEYKSDGVVVDKMVEALKERYSIEGAEKKVRDYLSSKEFEYMFRPNTLTSISQLLMLPTNTQSGTPHERHYDVVWVFDVVVEKEQGAWKIDRFVFRSATYREVNVQE